MIKKLETSEILSGCPNVKVSAKFFKFKLIAVSAKMLYQEIIENSLRSGRSQGKVKENESRKRVAIMPVIGQRISELVPEKEVSSNK